MAPAEVAILNACAAKLGVDVTRETVGRLGRFLDLLLEWNRRVPVTGERDPERILQQHVIDCLAPGLWLPASGLVIDVGSGAGFPGIILGCLRPDLELVLIEARRRPTSFLREAIRVIPLPAARAVELRAEDAPREPGLGGGADVVVSRALRLPLFLGLAAPLLAPHGSVIAMQTPRSAATVGRDAGGLVLA